MASEKEAAAVTEAETARTNTAGMSLAEEDAISIGMHHRE
jgi:hypothetical protein